MIFMVVDLPDPEAPMTATNSPPDTTRSTPFKAWNAVAPDP